MSTARVVKRFFLAVWVLTPVMVTQVRDRRRYVVFGGRRDLSDEQRRRRAEELADAFERLGTTYIKLAQFLTTRPDLLPPVYIRAMESLQDDVPPEPFPEILDLLREEIGSPYRVFDEFDEEPLAGASISQVHQAVYRGDDVVLKVRRPGLEELVDADLRVVEVLAPLAVGVLVYLGQESHAESAQNIFEELDRTIHEEMDLEREARVMEDVRENMMRDGLDSRVIVPRAYLDVSTERVLTMSHEEGIAVKHTEEIRRRGHDLEEVVDAIADAYLHMAFEHDVFQADTHQGNLAVAPDGRVVIYDYGIAQRPPEELQRLWRRMFMGVGLRDPSMVVDALEEMGALDVDVERGVLEEVALMMIRDVSGGEIEHEEMQRMERRIEEALYDYPISFPQETLLGMRANFGLDGLCADLAPEYDFSRKLFEFFVDDVDPEELPRFREIDDAPAYRALDEVDRTLGEVTPRIPFVSGSRPVTSLLLDVHRCLGLDVDVFRRPLDLMEFDGDAGGEASVDDLKEHITRRSRESDRRGFLAVLGASFFVSGVVLYTVDSALALPSVALGAAFFVSTWRSFRSSERGVLGPKYVATRHRIRQWEDEADEGGGEVDDGDDG